MVLQHYFSGLVLIYTHFPPPRRVSLGSTSSLGYNIGVTVKLAHTLPIYDFDLRATHARALLPAAFASVSFATGHEGPELED